MTIPASSISSETVKIEDAGNAGIAEDIVEIEDSGNAGISEDIVKIEDAGNAGVAEDIVEIVKIVISVIVSNSQILDMYGRTTLTVG